MLTELRPEANELDEAVSVRVEVASAVVRLALLYVAQDAGWRECPHADPCGCLLVSDRWAASSTRRVDVLVTPDEPAACQRAIDATLHGLVRAVVLWNEPAGLASACAALQADLTMIPTRVIELAGLAPRLTDRQSDTLRLLAAGRSSRSIAGTLHQSESTSKRDIAELLELFDAPNRTALVSTATELGFVKTVAHAFSRSTREM